MPPAGGATGSAPACAGSRQGRWDDGPRHSAGRRRRQGKDSAPTSRRTGRRARDPAARWPDPPSTGRLRQVPIAGKEERISGQLGIEGLQGGEYLAAQHPRRTGRGRPASGPGSRRRPRSIGCPAGSGWRAWPARPARQAEAGRHLPELPPGRDHLLQVGGRGGIVEHVSLPAGTRRRGSPRPRGRLPSGRSG